MATTVLGLIRKECVRAIPTRTSEGMAVPDYSVEERHTALWICLGDPDKADIDLIPKLTFLDEVAEKARIAGYMPTKANYQLITDNILDLSHADYLHPETLGGMMTNSDFKCWEDGDDIVLSWEAKDGSVPLAFKHDIPPPNAGDYWIQVRWSAPALMVLSNYGVIHGQEVRPEDIGSTLHNMVPETETTTHYFYCAAVSDPVKSENPKFMEMLKTSIYQAFAEEDKPMLEKQQLSIGSNEFWSLKPRLLPIDEGAVKVRRRLEALIKAEQGP